MQYLSDLDWEMLLSCGFGSDGGFLTRNLENEGLRGKNLVMRLKIKSLPRGKSGVRKMFKNLGAYTKWLVGRTSKFYTRSM